MKIVLIRHSESVDDIINCYGGAADFDITDNGKKKVEDFRKICKVFGIKKFFTSPYRRAYKTAEILNKDYNVEIEKIGDLRENNQYGVMCGVEKNLAKEIFAYFLALPEYKNASYYNRKSFYGGEKTEEFDKRVQNAFNQILKTKEETVGVVTHGGVLRSIFLQILKDKREILDITDLGYAEINFENKKFEVVKTEGYKFK